MKTTLFILINVFIIVSSSFGREYTSLTGMVTKLKENATITYRIGENTVGRGSIKHIKNFVDHEVVALCFIKNDKIVQIKSVSVSKLPGEAETPNITLLSRLYKDDRVKTISKYRGKRLNFETAAIGVKVYSYDKYVIFLEEGNGRLIVKKDFFSKDIIKSIYDLGHSKRAKRNRALEGATEIDLEVKSIPISFKGKWVSNNLDVFIFTQ